MIAINAGIGGDTAAGMHGRLERDVLALSSHARHAERRRERCVADVAAEAYERDVRAIADRLKSEHIPLILLTPNVLGPKQQAKGQKNLDAYESILRTIAKEQGLARRGGQPAAEAGRGGRASAVCTG